MTPDMTLGIDQTLPLLPKTKSNSSPLEENQSVSTIAASFPTKDVNPVTVDTVNISSQLQQVITDVMKEKTLFEKVTKQESVIANRSEKSDRTAAKVEFVYDQKGDLITKYLDSASRLVYQTPSELMIHLKETASKSDSSVDTNA